VTADPGTLTSDLYGRIAEVLPHRPVEAGGGELAERDLSAEPGLSLPDGFDRSLELIVAELRWLAGEEAAGLAHGELEERMLVDGREIQRLMLQDHLDLRAVQERRAEQVVDSGGVRHGNLEAGHERPLVTVFGEVRVGRIAYRARGQQNLYPADAVLNLPAEKHSTVCAGWPRSSRRAARSRTRWRRSSGRRASRWQSGSWSSSRRRARSTSRASTPRSSGPRPRLSPATRSSSRATGRGS